MLGTFPHYSNIHMWIWTYFQISALFPEWLLNRFMQNFLSNLCGIHFSPDHWDAQRDSNCNGIWVSSWMFCHAISPSHFLLLLWKPSARFYLFIITVWKFFQVVFSPFICFAWWVRQITVMHNSNFKVPKFAGFQLWQQFFSSNEQQQGNGQDHRLVPSKHKRALQNLGLHRLDSCNLFPHFARWKECINLASTQYGPICESFTSHLILIAGLPFIDWWSSVRCVCELVAS